MMGYSASQPLWYVLHVGSHPESQVKRELEARVAEHGRGDKILEVLVPPDQAGSPQDRMFPGYILVKMILDDETWSLIRQTPGITGFVGMGKRPTPLDENEVESVRYQMGLRRDPPARAKLRFVDKETGGDSDGTDRGPIN